LVPSDLLECLEVACAGALGKGNAALRNSKNQEVKSCLEFMQHNKNMITIFDVGANIGEWTDAVLELRENVNLFLFEPQSTLVKDLETKFYARENVRVINKAVARESGSRILYSNKVGSGLASLLDRDLQHFDISFFEQESVLCTNLDSFCTKEKVQPDIIKLDIEGYEMAALQGATETLQNVKVCQFEFGGANIDSRTFFRDFYKFFRELDFKLYRQCLIGKKEITSYSEFLETFTPTVYYAVKNN
jgi:FkbM family methyltransferase